MADIHGNVNAPDGGPHEVDEEITLRCGEDDTRTVKVLRSVLKKHSKYFEGEESFKSTEICFDPKIVTFEALQILVNYMTQQRNFQAEEENVLQLLVAADYLQIMQEPREIIMKFFSGKKNPKKTFLCSALRLLKIEDRFTFETTHFNLYYYHFTLGQRRILNFVAKSFKSIMFERPVLELDFDDISRLLNNGNLNIAEEDVLRVIKIWINHDYEQRKVNFPKLLYCVRYTEKMDIQWLMDELSSFCCEESEYFATASKKYLFDCLTHRDFKFLIPGSQLNMNGRSGY